jgi:hypothetical protein
MSGKKQNSAKFVGKKALAITALLTSPTIEAASQVAHIPTSTLRRWRARPDFAAALAAAQGEIFLATCNEIRQLGMTATKALAQVLRDEKAPTPSRVRAAGLILSLLLRSHQTEVLEARMTSIQAAIDALQRKSKGGGSHSV